MHRQHQDPGGSRAGAISRAACSPVISGIAMSSTTRSTRSRAAAPPPRRRRPPRRRPQVRLLLEDQPDAAPYQRVVVGQQDPDHGHLHGGTGTVSRTVVPWPAASVTSTSPPTSRARSRMPSCRRRPDRRRRSRGRRRRPRAPGRHRRGAGRARPGRAPRAGPRWSAPPARPDRRRARRPCGRSGSPGRTYGGPRPAACARHSVASAASAACRPRSSQDAGTQLAGHPSYVVEAGPRALAEQVQFGRSFGRRPVGELLEAEQHDGQALADLVVELLRDALPLGLLGGERLGVAGGPLGLEPVEHRVVAADQPGARARPPARRSRGGGAAELGGRHRRGSPGRPARARTAAAAALSTSITPGRPRARATSETTTRRRHAAGESTRTSVPTTRTAPLIRQTFQ